MDVSADELQKEHVAVLGPNLGPVYHAIYNECVWLQLKWQEYVELYCATSDRIALLNSAAGLFFRVVQDTLWRDTLLHLGRMTDPASSAGKPNLTVQRLPDLIADSTLREEMRELVQEALRATAFARDWRNRHIAHQDLALAIEERARPLSRASQGDVETAVRAIHRIVQRVREFYFNSDLRLDRVITGPNTAVSLLYVIRDGLEAAERTQQRAREGSLGPDEVQLRGRAV
jgi:hypothetical protein